MGNGFFYNDVDDVDVCGMHIEGFGIGFHLAGSNAPSAGSDRRNARIVLSHSNVVKNSDQGLLGGCESCGVHNTRFDNNGFKGPVFHHNVCLSGGPQATGMFALDNELSHSAIVGGTCTGVSLVEHGRLDGLRIEGNRVREDICAAGPGCLGDRGRCRLLLGRRLP